MVVMVKIVVHRQGGVTVSEASVNEVAVGNPDPVIDVGTRVNCWEIMDCRRTDCIGYMNLDHMSFAPEGDAERLRTLEDRFDFFTRP